MARLPRTIRVGPMTYKVTYDPLLQDAVGETKAEKLTIKLRPGQAPDYEADTLLHEVLHAVMTHAPIDLTTEQEEHVCLAIAPVLLDTLRRNPKFTDYLLGRG